MDKNQTDIQMYTPNGPDHALANVLVGALEITYGILVKGEAQKFAAALDKFEQQTLEGVKSTVEKVEHTVVETVKEQLPGHHVHALAIGKAMSAMVKPAAEAAPSKVAQVAELAVPEKGSRSV